ncbi:class A beta-lactamase [Amycolatopsis taiwanensis]|uniref:class A beta-lactamase n=1 Tax=Amycolatopsis taiwanensis TaxID=342230 RepID=UPI000693BAA8|nr:class A beta-lactamase [Amycolatopsis taiwanensis]
MKESVPPSRPSAWRSARLSLAALILAPLAACSGTDPAPAAPPAQEPASVQQADPVPQTAAFEELERTFDARLGVYAVDTATGRNLAYHADDRFGYASTHKVFTAGAVLQRTPIEGLERTVTYGANDLVPNSPITQRNLGTAPTASITLRAAMDAALRYSDNTADNLLFREIGGPAGMAAALREAGDTTTHADRIEPALNDLAPGEIRDTSTPRALAASLRAFTLGEALPEEKRTILTDMMRANVTGDSVIRAGTPAGWQVADKTGTAKYGTRNDIAVVWPPQRAPIVLVILSDRKAKDSDHDDKLIAQAAAAALGVFQ